MILNYLRYLDIIGSILSTLVNNSSLGFLVFKMAVFGFAVPLLLLLVYYNILLLLLPWDGT